MTYTINDNNIRFANGYSLEFEHTIQDTLIVYNVIIILVESPHRVIYNQNVFALSLSGYYLWRIGKIELFSWVSNDCPYTAMHLNQDGELVLFNWCDTAVVVDPQTGDVIRKWVTK